MAAHPSLSDYATFKLLHEFDPNKEGYVSKVRFHKAMYALHTRLKKRRIDIKLPWRWYIYGPFVELDLIDPSVFQIVEVGVPDASITLDPKGLVFFHNEPNTKGIDRTTVLAIDYEIKKLKEEYLETSDLVENAYNMAPIPFIPVLKKFDDWLHGEHKQGSLYLIEEYERFQSSLVSKYPLQEFPQSYDLSLRFLDYIHHLLIADAGLREARETSNEYRKVMAIGFSSKFNENIPAERIKALETRFSSEIQRFDDYLFHKEISLFSKGRRNEEPQSKELKILLSASFEID